MNKKLIIFIILTFAFSLSSCIKTSNNISSSNKNLSEVRDYLYVLACNDVVYGLSEERADEKTVGSEVGEIKRYVGGKPEMNGDLCITSSIDMKPPDIPIGSKIFEIKGLERDEGLVLKEGEIYLILKRISTLTDYN